MGDQLQLPPVPAPQPADPPPAAAAQSETLSAPTAPAESSAGFALAAAKAAEPSSSFSPETTVIAILACKRAHYLQETVDSLMRSVRRQQSAAAPCQKKRLQRLIGSI